jgi:hypothetical protein
MLEKSLYLANRKSKSRLGKKTIIEVGRFGLTISFHIRKLRKREFIAD